MIILNAFLVVPYSISAVLRLLTKKNEIRRLESLRTARNIVFCWVFKKLPRFENIMVIKTKQLSFSIDIKLDISVG